MKFKLTTDLDLSKVNSWIPIGNSSNKPFKGTFYGDNHKISNLTVNTDEKYAGLFGYVNNATITHLTLENCSVKSTYDGVKGGVGVLEGYAVSNSVIASITIIDSKVEGNDTKGYVGGIVGRANDELKLSKCCVIAEVSGGKYKGAIVGYNHEENEEGYYGNNRYASNLNNAQGYGKNINDKATQFIVLGKKADFDGVTISNTFEVGDNLCANVGEELTFTVPGSNYYIENAEKTSDTTYTYTVDKNSLPKFWEIKTIGEYTFDYKDGAYFIRSTQDFEKFANCVKDGNTCEGLTFKLDASIDFEGENFTAVENFAGTFDGNGYAIAADSAPFQNNADLKNINLIINEKNLTAYDESGEETETALYRVKNLSGVTYTANNNAELIYYGDYVYAPVGTTITLAPDSNFSSVVIDGATNNDDGTYSVNSAADISIEGYRRVGYYEFLIENGCYMIRDAAELENLAYAVNTGNDCKGLTFKLANDIELGEVNEGESNFTAIGNYYHIFKGTFDGDGHKISNLTINSSESWQGLFGYVYEGGTIKNVTLENATVTGNYNVGGVVGLNGGKVENCTVSGTVSGSWNAVGGVVGENFGTVKICSHSGAVSAALSGAGGIVGRTDGYVENCVNAGNVNAPKNKGVIFGLRFGLKGSNNYYLDNPDNVDTNGATQAYKLTPPAGYKIANFESSGGNILPINGEYFFSGESEFSFIAVCKNINNIPNA